MLALLGVDSGVDQGRGEGHVLAHFWTSRLVECYLQLLGRCFSIHHSREYTFARVMVKHLFHLSAHRLVERFDGKTCNARSAYGTTFILSSIFRVATQGKLAELCLSNSG